MARTASISVFLDSHVSLDDRLPPRFLSSWVANPRPHKRPRFIYGHSLKKMLRLAGVDDVGRELLAANEEELAEFIRAVLFDSIGRTRCWRRRVVVLLFIGGVVVATLARSYGRWRHVLSCQNGRDETHSDQQLSPSKMELSYSIAVAMDSGPFLGYSDQTYPRIRAAKAVQNVTHVRALASYRLFCFDCLHSRTAMHVRGNGLERCIRMQGCAEY